MMNIFKIFLKSIIFKFEVQSTYNNLYHLTGLIQYLPEAGLILKKFGRFKFLVNTFSVLLFFILWPFFLNPVISIYLYFLNSIKSVFYIQITIPTNIYMNLSDSKFLAFIDTASENYPNVVLQYPFYKKSISEKFNLPETSLYNITTQKSLFKALYISILSPFFFILNRKSELMLFTYFSFNWYWTYSILHNLSLKSIWFSNHYDQWTYLFSHLENTDKKYLVQHGTMAYFDIKSSKIFFPHFKEKITQINKIYCLNIDSEFYFKKYISNSRLEFEIVNSNLIVKRWPSNYIGKKKILIIGHENEIKFHQKLIEFLILNYHIDIAYKLHPRQFKSIRINNVWIIRNRNEIPVNDIVISYGSTLDLELKSHFPNSLFVLYPSSPKIDIDLELSKIKRNLDVFIS